MESKKDKYIIKLRTASWPILAKLRNFNYSTMISQFSCFLFLENANLF